MTEQEALELREKYNGLKPIGDGIAVLRKAPKTKTKGGIDIPDSAQNQAQEGTVVAVGKGKVENGKWFPPDIRIGDTVLFSKGAGHEITYNNETILMLKELEVLGIIKRS